jgi:hypothetical protein
MHGLVLACIPDFKAEVLCSNSKAQINKPDLIPSTNANKRTGDMVALSDITNQSRMHCTAPIQIPRSAKGAKKLNFRFH